MMNGALEFFNPEDKDITFFDFARASGHSLLGAQTLADSHRAYFVARGEGNLVLGNSTYHLHSGTLFFVFPGDIYSIDELSELECFYISFTGEDAPSLLSDAGVTSERAVFEGFFELIGLWTDASDHARERNDFFVAQSVLLYTLVLISHYHNGAVEPKKSTTLFEEMIAYTNMHYRDPDISIKKLSSVFFYTEKHITTVFKRNMGISFKKYITCQRMSLAQALIRNGETSVTELSRKCGYTDPLYFSKVFSKFCGISPREAIRKNQLKPYEN